MTNPLHYFHSSKHEGEVILLFLKLIFLFAGVTAAGSPSGFDMNINSSTKPSRRLAPCQSCKVLTSSFLLGMERTAKGHYGGGDTAWEEENKKSYKNSELRLTEIEESLCSEVGVGKDQCHEIASENENLLEEWWHKHRNAGEDLHTWLCVNKLELCCPDNHFGPKCEPCPGFPQDVCSSHGKCKGNGTRKGNGDCSCETGYADKLCDACAKLFYEAYKDDKKVICSACHKSCLGGCTGAGGKNCEGCKAGWEADEERGCIDLNECLLEESPCKKNEFCVNTEGSFSCIGCDKSCDGCFGDGPDMCERCANGFFMIDKLCIDDSTAGRNRQINTTRYLTYFGLCVATCIIFQKNMVIASVIGIAVGVYIAASEYLLSGTI